MSSIAGKWQTTVVNQFTMPPTGGAPCGFFNSITGVTGGGASNLDGYDLTTITQNILFFFRVSGVPHGWVVQFGVAVGDGESVVLPFNYDPVTNAKYFQRFL